MSTQLKGKGLQRTAEDEFLELQRAAEEEYPGILELLKVYGGYEEGLRTMQEYLEITSQEPVITTSNQTNITT